MTRRPKKPWAQRFISTLTSSATRRKSGSRAIARRRLRWLSSDIVVTCPSASSPSNIQPSAPESSAYATLRRPVSALARGRVAGPVPWIHWRGGVAGGVRPPALGPPRAAAPDPVAATHGLVVAEHDARGRPH